MKLKLQIIACSAVLSAASHAQQYWKTDGTSGTWTGSAWGTSASGPFTSAWVSNSNVQFTANSTVTFATASIGNVTVADGVTVTVSQAGTMSTNSAVRTFDIGTGSTLTWTSQNVSNNSASGFIKNGAGIWNIGAQGNLYTGGFTLNAGTVIVSGNNSFGGSGSALSINGGTIQSSGTRAYANSSITIGGNFTHTGTGNATFSGTVNLGSSTRTITNSTTSGSRVYSGVISGSSGAGLTFDGSGAGQIYIGNSGNSFSGNITINGGEVGFASDGSVGAASNTIVIDGGRFSAASTAGGAASYTLASTHAIQIGSTAGTSISAVSGGTLTYDGVISDKAGSTGSWAKQGSGTVSLGGSSSYTGGTAINNGKVLITTGNNRLPTGTVVSLGQSSSTNLGTLDLNGFNQQIAGLNSTTGTNSGTGNNTVTSTAAATLTLGGADTYSYGDGSNANSGIISGALSVVKDGTGTQILGDTNSYTGTTTVNKGKLVINGNISTSSLTTVNDGGTLGGGGTVGSVTVKSGGTLAPGGSAGILSTGTAIIESGAALGIEINSGTVGTGYDQLNVTGTVSLAGLLNIAMGFTPADGGLFFLIANDGTDAITGAFSNAPIQGATYKLGGQDFKISYSGDSATNSFSGGNDLVLQAIPEPGAALIGTAGWLLLLRRRRF